MANLNFTALDFETANSYRGSPCSVGLVKFRDGQPVDRAYFLMRPPAAVSHFDAFNTSLHGIDAATVQNQPLWKDRLPEILDFIDGDVVVCHNASFDIGVIRYACMADGLPCPDIDFFCTLVAARRRLNLPSYRLPFVLDFYGVTLHDHHNALADAEAAGHVAVLMSHDAGVETIEELARELGTTLGHLSEDHFSGSVSTATARAGKANLVLPDANPQADPTGYLYGRTVVFTGALTSMTRQMAWDAVAQAGGQPAPSTTKKTNILVIGNFDPAHLRPGAHVSAKAAKAFELQDKGQDIELMTEADFLQVLNGDTTIPSDLESLISGPEPQELPVEEPLKFRPLVLDPKPTTQLCSHPGCSSTAAFKTRSRPTWCEQHIFDRIDAAGFITNDPFTHPKSYALVICKTCGFAGHKRFMSFLEEDTSSYIYCDACRWAHWAHDTREMEETTYRNAGVDPLETFGSVYPGVPMGCPTVTDIAQWERDASQVHQDALGEAPRSPSGFIQVVRCQHCGKVAALRTNDLHHCTCSKCRNT